MHGRVENSEMRKIVQNTEAEKGQFSRAALMSQLESFRSELELIIFLHPVTQRMKFCLTNDKCLCVYI